MEMGEKWAPTGGDFTLKNASCGVVAALHAAVNQKSLRFSHLTNAQHSCRNLVCKLDFCSKRLP
jgi:hypothetical protein